MTGKNRAMSEAQKDKRKSRKDGKRGKEDGRKGGKPVAKVSPVATSQVQDTSDPEIRKVLTEERVEGLLKLSGISLPQSEVKELHLEGIGLNSIAPHALQGFDGLFKLFLSRNKLTTLPKRIFYKKEDEDIERASGPRKLTFLDLSENQLTGAAVQRVSKWNVGNLVTLKLAGNGLESFPSSILSSLPQLNALVLNDNKLKSIEFTTRLENLNTLILSKNEIEDLGEDSCFANLPGLKKLSASKNKLSQFPAVTATMCPLLAEVRLSGNKISCLTRAVGEAQVQIGDFQKLAVLDMSGNQVLEESELFCLRDCSALLHVSLAGNPFQQQKEFEDNKTKYAEYMLNEFLPKAENLRTLDSKPLSYFNVKQRVAPKKGKDLPATKKGNSSKGKEERVSPEDAVVGGASDNNAEAGKGEGDELQKTKLEEPMRHATGVEQVVEIIPRENKKRKAEDSKDKKKKKKKSKDKLEVKKAANWNVTKKIDTW